VGGLIFVMFASGFIQEMGGDIENVSLPHGVTTSSAGG
jgi:hypothetical protein